MIEDHCGPPSLTLEESREIVAKWGKYLTSCHSRLMTVFFLGHIPESLLPVPKNVLWNAVNVVAKFHFDIGDYENSEMLKSTLGPSAFYVKDEEAIEHFIDLINKPGLGAKEIIIAKLKEYREWRTATPDLSD